MPTHDARKKEEADKIKMALKVALGALLYTFSPQDLNADEALNASDAFFKAADEKYPGWTIDP